MNKFESYVMQPAKLLKTLLNKQLIDFGYKPKMRKTFLYAEGNYPVMLVAHLDTVHKDLCEVVCYSKDGNIVCSPQGIGGDDRCGAYIIMSLLEKLSVRPHILFTEGEEYGGIGAKDFAKSQIVPDINYIIEFDRQGYNDAVFYDCANTDFIDFVEQFEFYERYGSFSDISIIAPDLGVAAVNLSSGYYNAHTLGEYVVMSDMQEIIDKAAKMIETKTERFEYVESIYYEKDTCIVTGKNVFECCGYIQLDNGELIDGYEYYIGKNNKVYYYDEIHNVFVEDKTSSARREDGTMLTYDSCDSADICALFVESDTH